MNIKDNSHDTDRRRPTWTTARL